MYTISSLWCFPSHVCRPDTQTQGRRSALCVIRHDTRYILTNVRIHLHQLCYTHQQKRNLKLFFLLYTKADITLTMFNVFTHIPNQLLINSHRFKEFFYLLYIPGSWYLRMRHRIWTRWSKKGYINSQLYPRSTTESIIIYISFNSTGIPN